MYTLAAATNLIPLIPVPSPLSASPRIRTVLAVSAAAVMLTVIPLVPGDSTTGEHEVVSMVSDLSIVTTPKAPLSTQLISPPTFVRVMAPANVLQGAVRLQ